MHIFKHAIQNYCLLFMMYYTNETGWLNTKQREALEPFICMQLFRSYTELRYKLQ
jgi:hypothetical protein